MQFVLLIACVAAAAADVSHLKVAQAQSADAQAPILKQEVDVGPDGSYQWAIETGNGIAAQEQGELKNRGQENEAQVVQGQAQHTAPDGQVFQIQYIADENGYQPQGSHLPTPPPIPAAILRSLEYIAAHPPPPGQNQN